MSDALFLFVMGVVVGGSIVAAVVAIGIVWWASQFHDPSDASEEF